MVRYKKTYKKYKKFVPFLLIALIIGFWSVFQTTAQETKGKIKQQNIKNSVTLTIIQPDGDSGLLSHIVAQKKGFYKKNNVNIVQKIEIPESREALNMESDLYFMGRAKVYAVEAANPGLIKAFNFYTQDLNKWNDAILVRKNSGINSLKQVKNNQKIGLIGGGPARVPLMKILLEKEGVNSKNIQFISLEDGRKNEFLPSDISSDIQILYAREPFLGMLSENGWRILIDEPLFAKNIFSPWPMSMMLFSTKFLKEQPNLAKNIVQIYDEAIQFIRNNPDEAQTILAEYVSNAYKSRQVNIRLVNYLKLGEIPKELIQKQSDWYFENNLIDKKINADNLFYSEN